MNQRGFYSFNPIFRKKIAALFIILQQLQQLFSQLML